MAVVEEVKRAEAALSHARRDHGGEFDLPGGEFRVPGGEFKVPGGEFNLRDGDLAVGTGSVLRSGFDDTRWEAAEARS
eukprot:9501444-Pyramimonas_sp.AAC.1